LKKLSERFGYFESASPPFSALYCYLDQGIALWQFPAGDGNFFVMRIKDSQLACNAIFLCDPLFNHIHESQSYNDMQVIMKKYSATLKMIK
jgi:hypothetical protein